MKRAILLIGDNIPMQRLVKAILERRFDVYAAQTIEECRRIVMDHVIDIVILDRSFPEQPDGMDPADYLRLQLPVREAQIVMVNTSECVESGRPDIRMGHPAFCI